MQQLLISYVLLLNNYVVNARMGSKDFFQGRASSGFSRGSQEDFCSRGPKVAKFRFNHSKLRKQPFLLNI